MQRSRMRDRRSRIAPRSIRATALALTVLVLAQASGHAQQRKVKFLVPTTLISEAFTPLTVPKYLGYYRDEGLDVDLIASGGSNAAAIGVATGAGDLGAASPAEAIVGMQKPEKLDVRFFYDLYYGTIWGVSVLPESPIQNIADLKGKRIGVTSLGSAGPLFGEALGKVAGLNPKADLAFLSVGAGAQAMTALRQKAVDALIFSSEATTKFEVAGLKLRYLPLPEGFATLPDAAMLARQSTIANDRKMLVGVARAIAKGYAFTMANPAAAVKIHWKLYPETEPKQVAPEEALRGGVLMNQRRMEIWSSPKTQGINGKFIDEDWERLVGFLIDQGVLQQKVATSRIFTNDMLAEINGFDHDAINAQAKAFDLQTLR